MAGKEEPVTHGERIQRIRRVWSELTLRGGRDSENARLLEDVLVDLERQLRGGAAVLESSRPVDELEIELVKIARALPAERRRSICTYLLELEGRR